MAQDPAAARDHAGTEIRIDDMEHLIIDAAELLAVERDGKETA